MQIVCMQDGGQKVPKNSAPAQNPPVSKLSLYYANKVGNDGTVLHFVGSKKACFQFLKQKKS